ncbi:MAG: DUF4202 domain-containing protein [Sphingobacteriaceae bacterium]
MDSRLELAYELLDSYNSNDPNTYYHDNAEFPQELLFAVKVYEWVKILHPNPSEALLLASRCLHIGRWEISRKSYPEGKAGYLNWRSDLAKHHAQKAGELIFEAGYDAETIRHVQRIILKQQLKTDLEVQTIENALCLVFFQYEYSYFIEKHDDDKVIRILRKTWAKMTEPGRNEALKLRFSERGTALLEKALTSVAN